MFFTQEDYNKIQNWLRRNSVKDTEFPVTDTLSGNEVITIVQEGKNKKTFLKDFADQLLAISNNDFINVSELRDSYKISLSEAIKLVPHKSRKRGQVITFNNTEGAWEIIQFKGTLAQWNDESLWDDVISSFTLLNGSVTTSKLADNAVSKEKLDITLQNKIDLVDELNYTVNTEHIALISEHSAQIKKIQGELEGGVGKPITEVSVSVDNTTGTPSATASIQGTTLNLDFTGLKGEQGPAGTSVSILGSKQSEDELPLNNNSLGDSYLINGYLYVWDGNTWNNVGEIKGPKGDKGDKGEKGNTGPYYTPHVDSNGNLSWSNNGGLTNPAGVNIKGKPLTFDDLTEDQKELIRGEKGDPGITSAVVSVDDSSGTPFATASISDSVLSIRFSGLKGAQGNTGVTTDSFEIVNNLTEGGADKGLSAEMGKELSGKIDSLLGYTREFRQDDENISQYDIDVKSNFKVGDVINYTISNISNSEIKYFSITLIRLDNKFTTYEYYINNPAKQIVITSDATKIRIISSTKGGSVASDVIANTAYSFNVFTEGSAENLSNKVTEINENSTDIQYPSAACVYKSISSINNLMGTSFDIINDDESKYNAAVNFEPIKAGTRIKIIFKEYVADKAPYFLITIYPVGGKEFGLITENSSGKYPDRILTLSTDIRRIVITSTQNYGGTYYNAKFKFEVQVEGLKDKVDNCTLYTPNDAYTIEKSEYESKITEFDSIVKPEDYDYALKYEAYRKIEVKSQTDFENLALSVAEASKSFNNIDVNIAEGTYTIKDAMLDASLITNENRRIAISGNNVKILGDNVSYARSEALYSTGTHNVFNLKEAPTIGYTIFTDGNNYVPISESGFSVPSGAESFITPIVSADSANNEWKAQLPNRYSNMFDKTSGFENMRLWYACQWTGRLCEISKIDSAGYIYFKDKDNSPSPSADKNPSRFVLINNEPTSEGVYFDNEHIYIPIKYNTIYQHKESTLLKGTVNATSVTICGLNCIGVRDIISGTLNNTLISNCRFTSSRGFSKGAGNFTLQHNCKLYNCILEDFYSPKIFIYGDKSIIENNRFERLFRMQTSMPLGVLLCGNGTAYCGKNKFIDMASQNIWSGLFYQGRSKESKYNTFRSIIEYNEIYHTKDFKYDRYSCHDAGAIYLATNACNPIIRYNYIHDIKGYVTHGIYCDDGAYGFAIYKNIICNIMDGYSINSRIVKQAQLSSMGRDTDNYPSNVDNLCMHNLINAPYLFRGSTEYTQYANGASRENNGCCCAKNLRMEMLLGISKYETLVDDINEFEDDINSKGSKSADGVIKIGANISSWKMPSHFNGLLRYYTV